MKYTNTDDFYSSRQWLQLRYRVLRLFGSKCMACNRGPSDRITIHVDHIKPRSKYPELELDPDNLQVLCNECNLGKSNIYEDDFRKLPEWLLHLEKTQAEYRLDQIVPTSLLKRVRAIQRLESYLGKKMEFAFKKNMETEYEYWAEAYFNHRKKYPEHCRREFSDSELLWKTDIRGWKKKIGIKLEI